MRELYKHETKLRKTAQPAVTRPTMDTVYEVSESPSTFSDRDETDNESELSPKNILALPDC